jgi:hypothetical protein
MRHIEQVPASEAAILNGGPILDGDNPTSKLNRFGKTHGGTVALVYLSVYPLVLVVGAIFVLAGFYVQLTPEVFALLPISAFATSCLAPVTYLRFRYSIIFVIIFLGLATVGGYLITSM